MTGENRKTLVIDIGGTNIKLLATGRENPVKIPSGPTMTPRKMVTEVRKATTGWGHSAVSIGFPGPVLHGKPVSDPYNLGPGWAGFDFKKAFRCPVKVINDAAMQALGSYSGGRMLFLGLGTGLGSTLIVNGVLEPLELAHLPYKNGKTYEDYVGLAGLKRLGKKKWRSHVADVVKQLKTALQAGYVVLGGGNARLLKELPPGARRGDNANAFLGGFRLWQEPGGRGRRRPEAPPMKPEMRIVPDAEALYRAAAAEFVGAAAEAVQAKGSFTVALSGGSTPRGLYSLLASDPELRAQMPWDKSHFFWGDERHAPPDHLDSNYRMAQEAMLSQAPVRPNQVSRVQGEYEDAGQAAEEYGRTLREFFGRAGGQLPRLDLVLLGLGPEGHTASLFPGTKALGEERRLVVSNWVGKLYTERITMTAPVLNNAACVMFLVRGEDKALALKAVLEGPFEPEQLPAQLIRPRQGRLLWLVDEAAGRLLTMQGDREKR